MFCDSPNDPDLKEPNKNICAICTGQPGTLPFINKEAVKHILKIGLALNSQLADYSEFDRKNYFYPDIPKGYQISQYKYPLVSGGELCNVLITRVHLEEDTAKSSHEDNEFSLVDFNRAGIPLMELVTEPVIKSAEEAVNFAKELQILLQYLNAGEANMDKGEMRVEANISVSKDNSLGTKVEVKNLNSFKSVEKAINFEIERHIKLLEKGEQIIQETRGWDEVKEKTYSQRIKEESHDYRYFPEPDLPKLYLSQVPDFDRKSLERELPELPWRKRERYVKAGLKQEDADFFVRPYNKPYDDFFQKIMEVSDDEKTLRLASNYINSDLVGLARKKEHFKIDQKNFIELMTMIQTNKVSSRGAKDILAVMFNVGGDPQEIAKEKNLLQKSNEGELKLIVQKIIMNNPEIIKEYNSGKESVLQFLIGEGMKESRGSANPKVLGELFVSELNKS